MAAFDTSTQNFSASQVIDQTLESIVSDHLDLSVRDDKSVLLKFKESDSLLSDADRLELFKLAYSKVPLEVNVVLDCSAASPNRTELGTIVFNRFKERFDAGSQIILIDPPDGFSLMVGPYIRSGKIMIIGSDYDSSKLAAKDSKQTEALVKQVSIFFEERHSGDSLSNHTVVPSISSKLRRNQVEFSGVVVGDQLVFSVVGKSLSDFDGAIKFREEFSATLGKIRGEPVALKDAIINLQGLGYMDDEVIAELLVLQRLASEAGLNFSVCVKPSLENEISSIYESLSIKHLDGTIKIITAI